MKVIFKTFISLINNYLNEQTKYNQRNGGKKNSLKEGGSESHQFYGEKFYFQIGLEKNSSNTLHGN